jgi:hypothetical protein
MHHRHTTGTSVVTSYKLWRPFRCTWMIWRALNVVDMLSIKCENKKKSMQKTHRHHHRHHRHIMCTTGTPQAHHAWSVVTSYDLWRPFRCTGMIWRAFKCWYDVNEMGKRKKVNPENPQALTQARHMHHRHTTGTPCMICSAIIQPLKAPHIYIIDW